MYFTTPFSAGYLSLVIILLLLLLQTCGLHNQVITYEHYWKANLPASPVLLMKAIAINVASNPTYGSVTKIKIIFQNI